MDISRKLRLGVLALAFTTLAASPSFAQAESGGNETNTTADTVATPQNGWWTVPSEPGGRGVIIESNVATGEIFAAALAYEDGRAAWYVINTRRQSTGEQIGELQRFVGGQTLHGAYRGNAMATFRDIATFTFSTPTDGVLFLSSGAVQLRRYDIIANGVASGPAAGAPAGGWWWAPSESGRGFFVEAQGDNMFFAGMMYDDLGQPTWYSARGAMTTPSLFTGQLTLTYGGQTIQGSYAQALQSNNMGTVSIQFTSSTTATLTLPGGQPIAITRYTF